MTIPPARSSVPTPSAGAPRRVMALDYLRGLAVVLMIQAHGFDAWLTPAAKHSDGFAIIRHMSGLPSRLFLFLVGVAAAIRFEGQLARGASPAAMRRGMARRGLQVLGLAYLFRLQEHLLAGFKGGWQMLFRVDILNAIGASMLLVAAVAVPRRRRPAIVLPLVVAAFLLALGPIIGPAHFPTWLPRPLTSYIGGQRPMSWFPIFPWGAWSLVGVVIGHLWLRQSGTDRGAARVFLISAVVGVISAAAVLVVREVAPDIIHYPSELVQQMGPGSFFFRLGIIGALAGVSWGMARLSRGRFSPMVQLGQTSLLIYWIHVDLCYGGIARYLRGQLGIPLATFCIALLVGLMLLVSIFKTRHAPAVRAWWTARRSRKSAPPDDARPIPASAGGLGA